MIRQYSSYRHPRWLLGGLAGMLLAGCGAVPPAPGRSVPATASATASVTESVTESALPSLAPMIARVAPAVVNIDTEGSTLVEPNPLLDDPFFRRFLGLPDNAPGPRGPQRRRTEGLGSGVIIDAAAGFVVTNTHVVEQADTVRVTLNDGRVFDAELIGADPQTDVALLQIPAEGLTALQPADSDRLRVGDFVVAIGNPFGLGQTVTVGIVSALGRSGLGIKDYEDFIQTDASVNPGSSGGALVDLSGRLVGINTAILAPGGGNIGISFAIPINMVRRLVEQLRRFGALDRGRLGVAISDVAESGRRGALITRVQPGSAADRAGLQAGDLVTELNDRTIVSASALRNAIALLRVGDALRLGLIRDGRRLSVTAEVGNR